MIKQALDAQAAMRREMTLGQELVMEQVQKLGRLKERRKKIAPLTSCAFLRAAPQVRLHIADADKLEEGCGDARFVLAVRAQCHR